MSPRTSKPTSFERVQQLGLVLPGVVLATYFGMPALKLDGQMLACMASHKSAEPNTLVVRIDFFERDLRVANEPEIYYLKPHYRLRVRARSALADRRSGNAGLARIRVALRQLEEETITHPPEVALIDVRGAASLHALQLPSLHLAHGVIHRSRRQRHVGDARVLIRV